MRQTLSYSISSFTPPPAVSINPYEGKSRPVTVISSPVPVAISSTTQYYIVESMNRVVVNNNDDSAVYRENNALPAN